MNYDIVQGIGASQGDYLARVNQQAQQRFGGGVAAECAAQTERPLGDFLGDIVVKLEASVHLSEALQEKLFGSFPTKESGECEPDPSSLRNKIARINDLSNAIQSRLDSIVTRL